MIDDDQTAALIGRQGTIERELAVGNHSVALRFGEKGSSEEVKIEVVLGVAPPPAPPPAPEATSSLLQRIINFFRRLFGG